MPSLVLASILHALLSLNFLQSHASFIIVYERFPIFSHVIFTCVLLYLFRSFSCALENAVDIPKAFVAQECGKVRMVAEPRYGQDSWSLLVPWLGDRIQSPTQRGSDKQQQHDTSLVLGFCVARSVQGPRTSLVQV